jgi:hypothetical protein
MERAQPGPACARRARWTAVGRSAHPDASLAGFQAASIALGGHDEPGLLLVFAASAYDLGALADGIAEAAGDVPTVGCSTGGELDAAEGEGEHSVSVLALGGEGLSFSTVAVHADPRDAGAHAAACLGDLEAAEHRLLLLFADAAAGDPAEVVRGAYSVAGAAVPLAGAVAGHGAADVGGLLHRGALALGAVIGVAIGSDAPLAVGSRHGRRPLGAPMLVTRAAPGRVLELDGRPADEVYRERVTGPAADHPLGLSRCVGEPHLRRVTLDDGPGLGCAAPAGALVWLMDGGAQTAVAAADGACTEALGALDGQDPLALVVLDCQDRRAALGAEAMHAAIARLRERAGDAALVGACASGEIARAHGSVGFHDQSVVVLAVA